MNQIRRFNDLCLAVTLLWMGVGIDVAQSLNTTVEYTDLAPKHLEFKGDVNPFTFTAINQTRFNWIGFVIAVEADPAFPNDNIEDVGMEGQREVCLPIIGCNWVIVEVQALREERMPGIPPGQKFVIPPGLVVGIKTMALRNPKGVHFRFHAQPIPEPPLIGGIELKFQVDLDHGTIGDELRHELGYLIPLGPSPRSRVRKADQEWFLFDQGKTYLIQKVEGALHISEAPNPVQPQDKMAMTWGAVKAGR